MEDLAAFYGQCKDFSFGSYCETNAIVYAFMCTLVLATIFWVLSKITGEYSWVDRVWPLNPIFYGIHYLYHQQHCVKQTISTRQVVMMAMITLWGMKHTFNFWRKGGFKKGGEDYRWAYIRKNYPWIAIELLNFFFIAYYQLILIQWFSASIYLSR
jgi:steroid 5-alpha reductase family enzyme